MSVLLSLGDASPVAPLLPTLSLWCPLSVLSVPPCFHSLLLPSPLPLHFLAFFSLFSPLLSLCLSVTHYLSLCVTHLCHPLSLSGTHSPALIVLLCHPLPPSLCCSPLSLSVTHLFHTVIYLLTLFLSTHPLFLCHPPHSVPLLPLLPFFVTHDLYYPLSSSVSLWPILSVIHSFPVTYFFLSLSHSVTYLFSLSLYLSGSNQE